MALTKCKECGSQVSTQAKTCPSCGAPVKNEAADVAAGCGGCLAVVVLIVALPMFCNKAPDKVVAPKPVEAPQDVQLPATFATVPGDVTYTIADIQENAFGKQVDVQLNRRVSKEVLKSIAMQIKLSASAPGQNMAIFYRLSDQEAGVLAQHKSGIAWATAHFAPALEVKILGTSEEDHARLEAEASKPVQGDVIGRWRDNETAFPGVITLSNENGKVIKTKLFADGTSSRHEMVAQQLGSETRYIEKKSKLGDYLVIDANGDLNYGDKNEGLWAKSPQIK